MNRWTDLLASFGIATLLHGLLVLGAVWFWTMRPPELRPVFQGGDVSLAVTFVAEARGASSVERGAMTDIDSRKAGERTTDDGASTLSVERKALSAEREVPVVVCPQPVVMPDSAAEPPPDALRQGVSGAVRRKSEIRPYYPLGARLRGEEGTVTVRVWVKPSGRVSRSEVIRSSGFPALDEAAVDAARRARYVSTRLGAWRAEAETTLTFRFRLTE